VVVVLILMNVYDVFDGDSSASIAFGVIMAAIMGNYMQCAMQA
jgi:hypothetical protein